MTQTQNQNQTETETYGMTEAMIGEMTHEMYEELATAERTSYGEVKRRLRYVHDVPDEALVIIYRGYYADDGTCRVRYEQADDGEEAAQAYVSDGDWGTITATDWIDVATWRVAYIWDAAGERWLEDRLDCEEHTITLEPEEPHGCEHDWCSPHSVHGHGGGAIIRDVCRHCGIYRVRDTWAQRWDTGEQGLRSVGYEDADEVSLAWVEEERRRRDEAQ